jgi:hypothetical protein
MLTPSSMRIIAALVLMAHGLGHALGILAGMEAKLSPNHSLHSWLFTGLLGNSFSRFLGILLSSLGILAFFATGFSLMGWVFPVEWWKSFGVIAALISLFLLLFYWNFLPFLFPNKIGALLINLWLLLSIIWWHWPTALFL